MTATRMLGVDSWFSYDACPLADDINIDGWLLEYAGGAVVVPIPTFDEEQIVEAVLVDDDEPMPDQVDTTIDPWIRTDKFDLTPTEAVDRACADIAAHEHPGFHYGTHPPSRSYPDSVHQLHSEAQTAAEQHAAILDTFDRNTAGQPVETKLAEHDRAEAAFASLREPDAIDAACARVFRAVGVEHSLAPRPVEPDLEDAGSLGSRPAPKRRRR